MLEIRNLRLDYEGVPMIYDFALDTGQCLSLIGPSGGGKTTLLNLIAGFETPVSGQLTFRGQDLLPLPPQQRPVTMLFQEHNLFPHLSAFQNVALGVKPTLKLSGEATEKVNQALDRVGLNDLGQRLPGELSGGQRQRVALARSLVRNRPLLLLDEPFSALDPGRRARMLALVDELRQEQGLTIVMASHAPEDARKIADRVAFIADGRIQTFGTPESVFQRSDLSSMQEYLGK